jgi:hypothetical protein
MGEIVTYKNGPEGVFCQIKFTNGERILISIAQPGIQIYKLGFKGLFPTSAIWKTGDIDQMVSIFGDFGLSEGILLNAVIEKIIGCESIAEVRALLSTPGIVGRE